MTPSLSPICRTSTSLPLKAKELVREATWMPGSLPRALMISSVMPSAKYSFSGSALMFLNGSTPMAAGAAAADSLLARCDPVIAARPMSRSASANSAAVGYRSTGVRASARVTAASTASGTSRVVRTLGIGDTNRLAMMACGVMPVKGGSPVSISNRTQPSEYRSLRPSVPNSPADCSGLMYAGVPTANPVCVMERFPLESALPIPKSATIAAPSWSRMFSGLMSRWTTLCRCA